jgi:tetratricopeptide (TPR) repeat protein
MEGWAYYKKDLFGQATLYLQQSLDVEPANPVYTYHLGMAYARKGEDAKARRLLGGRWDSIPSSRMPPTRRKPSRRSFTDRPGE